MTHEVLHTDPGCNICLEFSGAQAPLHVEMIPGSDTDRRLLESLNFVVVPSIGALRAGHVLVLPKLHAFGTLRLTPEMIRECETLVRQCANRLHDLYGEPVIVFEHGSTPAPASRRSSCVAHAHIHLLPGPKDFVQHITEVRSRPRSAWLALNTLAARAPLPDDYLLVGLAEPHVQLFLRRSSSEIPSQFFRQAYAEFANLSTSWDWRFEPAPALFRRTIADWFSGRCHDRSANA